MSRRPQGDTETGLGLLYAWWRDDELPALAPLPGLATEPTDRPDVLAQLGSCSIEEAAARMQSSNQAYVARLNGHAVAYGWSAAANGSIGELDLTFAVPPGNRYLWDFATLPAWRGRGIYPHLLQDILRREALEAERFWIGHDRDNLASGRGILNAGFALVGRAERQQEALALRQLGSAERASAGAALLGIRLLAEPADRSRPESCSR